MMWDGPHLDLGYTPLRHYFGQFLLPTGVHIFGGTLHVETALGQNHEDGLALFLILQ